MPSKSVRQECAARVSSKSPARLSSKSAKQESPAKVSSKSVKKECQEKCLAKIVKKECQERVSCQECPARVSSKEGPVKSVQQYCPARVSSKSAKQECLAKSVLSRVSSNTVQHECQARVPNKSVQQSVQQEFPMSRKLCRAFCGSKPAVPFCLHVMFPRRARQKRALVAASGRVGSGCGICTSQHRELTRNLATTRMARATLHKPLTVCDPVLFADDHIQVQRCELVNRPAVGLWMCIGSVVALKLNLLERAVVGLF